MDSPGAKIASSGEIGYGVFIPSYKLFPYAVVTLVFQ